MKVKWRNIKGNVEVDFEVDQSSDLVKKIALLEKLQPSMSEAEDQTLFEALASAHNNDVLKDEACGKCKSTNTYHVVRVDKEDNKYYELRCPDCYAKLPFGANKKGGGLFAKRRDESGIRGSNGWVIYNPQTKQEE
mgnify:FL=1